MVAYTASRSDLPQLFYFRTLQWKIGFNYFSISDERRKSIWIFTLIFCILAVIITFVFRRWVDRKSFISLGLKFEGHGQECHCRWHARFIYNLWCQPPFEGNRPFKMGGYYSWIQGRLFLSFGSTVLIAFYEELIFRGYILNNLMDSFPKWLSLLISSLLFMLFHWTTLGFFPLVNTFIMGLILGLNYIYTRNLWFSICFHIGWIFMVGPVLGFSGDESFQTLLQTEMQGDENITGGTSGLEGSVFLTAFLLLSLVALIFNSSEKTQSRISTSSRSNMRSFPASG